MNRVMREENGSYRWSCSIDRDYHKKSGRMGLWSVLILCAAVLAVFFIASRGTNWRENIWIPLLVIGVILVIAVPLLLMWNSAGDPQESYVMTENYLKSGYGKSAVFSEFKNTKEMFTTEKYIELTGKNRTDRIYVPPEDMNFVREFIQKHLPEEAVIR